MMVNISVIEAKFRRSKLLANYTLLWKDLSEEKKKLLNNFALNQGEQIIICCKESDKIFYYLTNLRVISQNYSVFYSEIELVNIVGIEENKTNITELLLCLKTTDNRLLKLEQGTWTSMFDILKLLIRQSIETSNTSNA